MRNNTPSPHTHKKKVVIELKHKKKKKKKERKKKEKFGLKMLFCEVTHSNWEVRRGSIALSGEITHKNKYEHQH